MKLLVTRPKVAKEFRMDVHQNARLTPHCRALLVERVMRGRAKRALAAEFGVTVKTASTSGSIDIAHEGLARSAGSILRGRIAVRARPHGSCQLAVVALRRQRLTLLAIAQAAATPARAKRGADLSRRRVEPLVEARACRLPRAALRTRPAGRAVASGCEETRPNPAGGPSHHGRGGSTRIARPVGSSYTSPSTTLRVWPTARSCRMKKTLSAAAFLRAAIAYYAGLGVTVREILTDNGSCYRSGHFAQTCRELGVRHRFTQTLHATHQWQGRALHPERAA